MAKILVTGGAGFIGSHIAGKLIEQGNQVTVIDDLSTGKVNNIPSGAEFIQGSILDLPLLERVFQGIVQVFHLAAIASVPQSVADPVTTNAVNIRGTLNVLLAARDRRVGKVILASSSSVYGNTKKSPQKEDILPAPCSPYALTKLVGEHYCNIFTEVYGLPTVCLRYFNVYGSRQNPKSQYALVIPAFVFRAFSDLPLLIYGDGGQERDFIFIEDVVEATLLAANTAMTRVYNVGSGRSISINRLAHMILRLTGKHTTPIYKEARLGEPRRTCADIRKLISAGYKPKWSLLEGLEKVIGARWDTR